MSALPDAATLPPGIAMEDFGEFHLRVVAGREHPLLRKRRVTAADLARHSWVLYQHDKDTLDKLTAVMRAGGAESPNVIVVTTSLHAVMQFLKSGPYLACLADAYLRAMPEPGVGILPFRSDIWSFPSGALYHASVRNFAPISALVAALHELSPQAPRHAKSSRRR